MQEKNEKFFLFLLDNAKMPVLLHKNSNFLIQ